MLAMMLNGVRQYDEDDEDIAEPVTTVDESLIPDTFAL